MKLTTNQRALVIVLVLCMSSLFYFAWLSSPRRLLLGDEGSTIDDLDVRWQEQHNVLVKAVSNIAETQKRTEELLALLAQAQGHPPLPIQTSPTPPSSADSNYPHNAYKRWLAQLGTSSQERTCEEHTGLSLVERFRKSKTDWCKDTTGTGRLECYHLPGWGSRSHLPDTLCEGFNLVLDMEKIPWNPPTDFDSSGQNRHPHFTKGSFSAQCEVDEKRLSNLDALFGKENKFMRALWSNFEVIPKGQPVTCDVVYDHPVVIIMRYEAWNLYHQLGEWINAFTTLEVVDKLDQDTQMLLLDMHETTDPFTDMLKVFSPNHPLVLGKELVGKGKICFKDAIMPYEGYGTFIHNNVWRASHGEPCYDSDILKAFSHFVLNKLGMLDKGIPNEPRITLISRKDYMGRKIDRKIVNEDDLVNGLKEVSKGRASFEAVQFEGMTFKEQVELIYSKTNILIGVHGAGLSHTVFLPPEAILIELLPGSYSSFTYFRNLAKQSNHIYVPIHVSDGIHVDVEKVKKVVSVAISIASSFNSQMGKD